jgi:hypothetical protein
VTRTIWMHYLVPYYHGCPQLLCPRQVSLTGRQVSLTGSTWPNLQASGRRLQALTLSEPRATCTQLLVALNVEREILGAVLSN